MNTSLQAAGDRRNWPRDDNYPWRLIMWVPEPAGWRLDTVSEWPTQESAMLAGNEERAALVAYGYDLHFTVGEVA